MAATSLAPVREIPAASGLELVYLAERLLAAALLLSLSPLLALVGATVWALSGRSPLIAHLRAGQYGEPFWVLKFRTMWQSRPARRALELLERVTTATTVLKRPCDPRVTSRFARFCRRFSLDELPQLVHVARGQMSLVGPRPTTAAELDAHYGRFAAEVLRVRPGITGLWQIKGRNRLSYRQRLRLDLFLVRHNCLGLYLRVLAATIPRVMRGDGAW